MTAHFLKDFVSNPTELGAITPSSSQLANALVESIDWSRVSVVTEYGPGLGAITEALIEKAREKDFFTIELNEKYANALSKKFPNLCVYQDTAANVQHILASHGAPSIDAIVSSLPWVNFSETLQEQLLDATMAVLSPGGQFSTFSYIHGLALKSGIRFSNKLSSRFKQVKRSRVVWRSIPPAIVYHCEL